MNYCLHKREYLTCVNITVFDNDKMIGNKCNGTLIHFMDMLILETKVNFTVIHEDIAKAISFKLRKNTSNESIELCQVSFDDTKQCNKHQNKVCFCHTVYDDGIMDIIFIKPALTAYNNARIFAQTTSWRHNEPYESIQLDIPPIYDLTGFLRINKTYSDIKTTYVIRVPAEIEYCCSKPLMNCEAAIYFGNNILVRNKSCALLKYSSEKTSALSFSVSACGHTNKTQDVFFVPQSDISTNSETVPTSQRDNSKKPESDITYTVVLIILGVNSLELIIIMVGAFVIFKLWKKVSSLELDIQNSNNVKQDCQCKQQKSSVIMTNATSMEGDLDEVTSSKALEEEQDRNVLSRRLQRFKRNETQVIMHQDRESSKLMQIDDGNDLSSSEMDEMKFTSNVFTQRDFS